VLSITVVNHHIETFIGLTLRGGGSPRFFNLSLMIVEPTSNTHDYFDEKYNEMKYHLQKLFAQSLISFDLNIRTLCSLERSGVRTLGDLLQHSRDEVKQMRRLGVVSVAEIDTMLDRYHLHYGMAKKKDVSRHP
jgi:DNA-directed RNA polymerase subunit alpha